MVRSTWVPLFGCLAVALPLFLGGCSSAQKTIPHMGFGDVDVNIRLERDDVVVLDRVEGYSTTTTIFGGLIRIIDGRHLQLLGIKFFQDKYTYFQGRPVSGTLGDIATILGVEDLWAKTVDRAYYKALEKHPEADAVFVKSMDHEDAGIPCLFATKTVRVKGKAVKLKADQ